jgi:hypothetical protein
MIGNQLPKILNKTKEFKTIEMTPDDAGVFGILALGAKYGQEALVSREFNPFALMTPLRQEDNKNTLWTAYNIVQEKLIEKGGKFERRTTKRTYWNREDRVWEKAKTVAARPASGPTENIRVNKVLWDLTEDFNTRIKEKGHFEPGIASQMMEAFRAKREVFKEEKHRQEGEKRLAKWAQFNNRTNHLDASGKVV